jgi:hypothetical protein
MDSLNSCKIQKCITRCRIVALVVPASWNMAKQIVANLYLYSCDFKYQIELRYHVYVYLDLVSLFLYCTNLFPQILDA